MRIFFFLLFFLWTVSINAQSQRHLKLVTKSNGEVILFGIVQGGMAFNNGDTIGDYNNFYYYYFLAAMDSNGLIKWTKKISGDLNNPYQIGLCKDTFDNIYISASNYTSDTLRFDSINYLVGGSGNLFVAKFNSTGQFIWAKQSSGSGGFYGNIDIAVDPLSNVYVCGNYSNNFSFGSLPPISNNSLIESMFVVKFDSAGNAQWIRSLNNGSTGQGSNNFMKSISVDSFGNSYLTGDFGGFFGGTLHFGSLNVTANNNNIFEIFIAKCDSAGNPIWIKKVDGMTGSDRSEKILSDSIGNFYLTGLFTYGAMFGALPAISAYYQDLFISRFDSSGNVQWVHQGSPNYSNYSNFSRGISIDQNGSIFTLGNFDDSLEFAPLSSVSTSNGDGFLLKQDSNGIPLCISTLPLMFYDIAIQQDIIFTIGENNQYTQYQSLGFQTNKYIITRWNNNCNIIWDSSIVHITPLPWGINESNSDSNFRVFPNPVNSILFIETPVKKEEGNRIEILDITGRLIYMHKLDNAHIINKIDLSTFNNGIYIIRLTTKTGSVTKKLIKL